MKTHIKPISKAVYDRAKGNHGYVTEDDMAKVFSSAELFGYGVYSPIVCEKNGYYFVSYELGDSCD